MIRNPYTPKPLNPKPVKVSRSRSLGFHDIKVFVCAKPLNPKPLNPKALSPKILKHSKP